MVWFKWPGVTAQKLAASAAAAKKLTTIEGVLSVEFGMSETPIPSFLVNACL
jgi:hypothetical protein